MINTTLKKAVLVLVIFITVPSFAGTVAYWELDDGASWDKKDSVAWYDVTAGGDGITTSTGVGKVDPIPNPDLSLPWSGDGDDSTTNPFAGWFSAGDYFYVPHDSNSVLHNRTFDLDPTKSFTVDGWFRASASGVIIGNQHAAGDAEVDQFGNNFKGWRVFTTGGGTVLNFDADGYAGSGSAINLQTPVTKLELFHFAAVFDVSNDIIELYLDGVLKDSIAIPTNWTSHRGGAIAFGARDLGDGLFASSRFAGGIDELRYSNIAIGPKDFLNAERTVAYWELDGASWGLNPNDSVGENHLTAIGSITDSALFVDPIPNPDRSLPWLGDGDDAATNDKAAFFSNGDGADVFYIPNNNIPHVPGDPNTHDATFDIHPEKSFTVDGWFRVTTTQSASIIGNSHAATASHQANGGYTGWRFFTSGGGTTLTFDAEGSDTSNRVTLTAPIVFDTLHHFAGAFDADAREMRLYLDGKLVDSSPDPNVFDTWSENRGGALAIGARDEGSGFIDWGFTGAIDEIRYSAYAFEEKDLLNYVEPIIAYWELDGALWDGRDSVGTRDVTFVGSLTDSTQLINPVPNRETSSPWWGQYGDDESYNPNAAWFTAGDVVYVPNTNDPIQHDSTFDLDPDQSFTVDGWFSPNHDSGIIIGNQHHVNSSHQVNGTYKGWRVYTTEGGVTLNFAADGQAASGGEVVLSGTCQDVVLQHFAAVYDADEGEMSLYLDGFMIDSATVPGTWSSHRGGSVAMGGRDDGDGTFDNSSYVGVIDEVRLINRALKPSQFLSPSFQSELQCGDYGYLAADFNRDCYVNIDDLVDMMENWLYQ